MWGFNSGTGQERFRAPVVKKQGKRGEGKGAGHFGDNFALDPLNPVRRVESNFRLQFGTLV